MPSCNTYRLTWISLTLDMWYLLMAAQQSAATAPYLGGVVSPPATAPDLERGVAPLGPPAPAQPPLFGHGVVLLSRRP